MQLTEFDDVVDLIKRYEQLQNNKENFVLVATDQEYCFVTFKKFEEITGVKINKETKRFLI